MRTQLWTLALLLALGGCGEDAHYRNRDPGKMTQQQFEADSYQCERENTTTVMTPMFGRPVAQPYADPDMVARCLRVRGWSRVK